MKVTEPPIAWLGAEGTCRSCRTHVTLEGDDMVLAVKERPETSIADYLTIGQRILALLGQKYWVVNCPNCDGQIICEQPAPEPNTYDY